MYVKNNTEMRTLPCGMLLVHCFWHDNTDVMVTGSQVILKEFTLSIKKDFIQLSSDLWALNACEMMSNTLLRSVQTLSIQHCRLILSTVVKTQMVKIKNKTTEFKTETKTLRFKTEIKTFKTIQDETKNETLF